MASPLPLDEPTKIVDPLYKLNGTYTITRDNTEKQYYEITNSEDNTKVLVPMDKIGEIEGFTNSEFANSADGVITTDIKTWSYPLPSKGKPFYKVKKIKTSVYSFKKHPPSKEPMALMFPPNDIHVPTAYAEERINPSTGGRRRNRRSTKKTRKHRRRTNRRLRR